MKRASKEVIQSAVMGFGIPAVLLCIAMVIIFSGKKDVPVPSSPTNSTGQMQTQPTPGQINSVQIPVILDDEVCMMDLESYVIGVVLAEMPASFEMEALKAQAVAARTYALKTCNDGKKHDGAVCGSYLCCQSYITEEDYVMKGWNERYVQRVREAVSATVGQVLTYDGKLIRSTYFSCSGGRTEDALEVWGRDYPYLQSVKSPGEEETVYFTDTKEFTPEDLQEALGVALTGTVDTWFDKINYTEGGGVDTMEIGGVSYRGTTLRSLLALRSTVFEVVASEEKIIFVTRGYGHRVGMSQYGADAMAMEGCDYTDILQYYYLGTEIVDYDQMLT